MRAGIVAVLVFTGVWADAASALDLTPFIGYRFGGSVEDAAGNKVNIDDSPSYGFILGSTHDPYHRIELLYSHQATELSQSGSGTRLFDLNVDYLHIGGTYMADKSLPVRPFASGGLGLTYMDPSVAGGSSETRFSLSFGGGAEWFPVDNVGLRLEARADFTMLESGGSLFCANGGCELYVSGSGVVQYETLAGVTIRF